MFQNRKKQRHLDSEVDILLQFTCSLVERVFIIAISLLLFVHCFPFFKQHGILRVFLQNQKMGYIGFQQKIYISQLHCHYLTINRGVLLLQWCFCCLIVNHYKLRFCGFRYRKISRFFSWYYSQKCQTCYCDPSHVLFYFPKNLHYT